ncbi:ABC transporter ATP-binding protein [Tomitella fengzijianii]|uniref:Trehalose import ATP-binding protein SugC n=1 Tax=Tomitella fengzijianii TaxID=2597660 RepID=A0A516X6Z2_9ACTN|nr:sn-glycerol-3-phosphate ABC transporter ATP-binding protein UgpC [Tomitella fengzijianii]QDQ98849.1 sn-glycerol-3-phosphate ABC transporter ATP-binding protein UgpC [Tomitella fengzijianii]
MASVTYARASCIFPGSDRPAVDALDLEIVDGELLVLVGPSGCGKSTSLRMLAGLEHVSSGGISIGDRDVTGLQPKDRDVAMVFQNYALYPHMSVAENMGFGLKLAKTPKAEIAKRVAETAELLGLTEFLGRKPKALSGGQRQRVAMGRAIVRQPQVFLMDEPLSNLDAKLRVQTRAQIADLQRRLATTMVYVTHDQVEAMTMGDRVAVLRDGVLQQCAPPRELYNRPVNEFVAGFIGSPAMNLLRLPVVDGGVRLGDAVVPVERETADRSGGELVLGIRPEHFVTVGSEGAGDRVTLELSVDVVEELGADAYMYGHIAGLGADAQVAEGAVPGTGAAGPAHQMVARADWRTPPRRGDRVTLAFDPAETHLFSAADGARVG